MFGFSFLFVSCLHNITVINSREKSYPVLSAWQKSVALLLFIIPGLHAQINKTIPEWVNTIHIKDVSPVNKNQVKDGYYYLLVDEQYNKVKKHNYFHYATSAITEEALTSVSQIEFSYDPSYQKAFLHMVKIHRGNEVIDKINTLELKTLTEESQRNSGVLNGNKTLYSNLSDIRKGDIIEYSYSIIGQNPIQGGFFYNTLWLSYSVPVGKIYLRLIFPKEISPTILYKNTSIKPQTLQKDVNDYVWEINNPPITAVESSAPNWYNPYATIQITNFTGWPQVKEHFRSLFQLSSYNKFSLKKIVDSIVASDSNKELQINSIIEFVQTHIRYSGNENGIYSHVPRHPDIILKNRYGDCKEKSVLLNEMLALINVEAYPVLINTSIGEKVVEEAPSTGAFNHCISVFSYKDKFYFIDPTISYQRGHFKYRIIPNYEIGMVLDNKPTPFTKIEPDHLSTSKILEEIIIENDGSASIKITCVYTGTNADEIRYDFLTNSIYDVQESYKSFYTKYGDDVEVLDTVIFTDNAAINEFTTIESYSYKKFWALEDSSKSKIITKDFMPYALYYKLNFAQEPNRKDPLKISFPLIHTQTITITKAGGWNVKNEIKEEKTRFFDYSYASKLNDKTLELTYNYVAKTAVIMPDDYMEYKSKMEFINSNMVFGAQEKPVADGLIGFNWPLLLTILFGLAITSILSWHLYKRVHHTNLENRFDSIGGWLVLVGIGVTLNPLLLLIAIYTQTEGEMGVNYAVYFFSEKSSYFSPMMGYFSLFVSFINASMFVYSILLVILFYQKKKSFRPYYCFFRIFNTLFLITNVIILTNLYSNSDDPEERILLSKETSGMIRVFIQTCIWVPYIWFSERSKHTFTNEPSEGQSPFQKTE